VGNDAGERRWLLRDCGLRALLFERFMEERERMFWVLGFLGSFTTFSSYALQTTESWAVSPFLGTLYGGGSIFLGLLAALLGLRLTRAFI
jgi:fluoride exporter